MKTIFLIIIVGLIILSSVIFVAIWYSIPEECDDKCEHEPRAIEAGRIGHATIDPFERPFETELNSPLIKEEHYSIEIIELFKQKYRTWTYSNQTTLIASDPYNQTITLFLNTNENEQIRIECMHNDWRGLEIITENVVEYFENENCYEPMLEETNSIP